MNLPKFLLADNSQFPDAIFVIHTEFPRFILNLDTEEISIMEELESEEDNDLTDELEKLIVAANDFYEKEMEAYEEDEDFKLN